MVVGKRSIERLLNQFPDWQVWKGRWGLGKWGSNSRASNSHANSRGEGNFGGIVPS